MTNQIGPIVEAVKAIHDASTPNQQRIDFTKAIEDLKETNPLQLIPIAFQLVAHDDSVVQQVGWNIIDHLIRYKWLGMENNLLIELRNGVLKHMVSRNFSLTQEGSNVKTALVRSLVSMIEQEWPQNWPELIPNLKNIVCGETSTPSQCNMVFLVIRRLIEDVVTLSNIEHAGRRKDLYNSVVMHINEIIKMTLFRIKASITLGFTDPNNALLAKSGVELLGEIVEWVPIKSISDSLDDLIEICCALFCCSYANLHEEAARCLYRLTCRKRSKSDESIVVTSMFKDIPVKAILHAANEASLVSAASPDHYKFLKSLTELLCSFGTRVSEIWEHMDASVCNNFSVYLSALFSLFNHPSVMVRGDVAAVLVSFALNAKIAQLPAFQKCMDCNLVNLVKSMEKVGSLSKNDNDITSHYLKMDYEEENDFSRDSIQLRDRCTRLIHTSMSTFKDKYFNMVADWLQNRCLSCPQNIADSEWDCFIKYIKTVVSAAYQKKIVDEAADASLTLLFDSVFNQLCSLTDLKLIEQMLSVCGALFDILKNHPDRIPRILDQLKKFLFFPKNDLMEVKVIKRHSMIVMLKLVTSYSAQIQPYAENLYQVCCEAFQQVTIMQRCTLVQVLSGLSNLCPDPTVKSDFLRKALQMNIDYIESSDFGTVIEDPVNFLRYVGFTERAVTDEEADNSPFIANRILLKSNLYTIDGVLQQVSVPGKKENPLHAILNGTIPKLFKFAKTLNSIYDPKYKGYIHASYENKLLDISIADRQILLNQITESENNGMTVKESLQPLGFAQKFISEIHDSIQSIVGLCGTKLSFTFYQSPNCGQMLNSLVENIGMIPHHRQRFWIRRAWRPLIVGCPVENIASIGPMLLAVITYFNTTLDMLWKKIEEIEQEEDQSEDEILFDHITCVMTREVVTLYRNIFMPDGLATNGNNGDESKKNIQELLNPRGEIILKEHAILNVLIPTLMRILTCRDTNSAIRTISIARIVVDAIEGMCEEGMAKYIFTESLHMIQAHGSDEVAVGPILQFIYNVYVTFRPKYPTFFTILENIPESSGENLMAFDNRIMTIVQNKEILVEKIKRDIVKKVLKPIITINLGQQHKRPAHLRSLPKIEKFEKFKPEADYSGVSVLFSP